MDRPLWAVLAGTFSLRFSTGLTGAMLGVYLATLPEHGGPAVCAIVLGVFGALFYLAELVLSPIFGILSDRQGHHRVMLYGPIFGAVAVIMTGFTADLGLPPPLAVILAPITGSLVVLGVTRVLEGASTAASIPSILGYIAMVTAGDELLRGKAAARFEGATLLGLGAGFGAAPVVFALFGPTAFFLNALLYGVSFLIFLTVKDPAGDRERRCECRAQGARRFRAIPGAAPQLPRLAAGADLDRGQRVDRAVVQPVDLPVRPGEPGLPGPVADARLQRGPDLGGGGRHRDHLRARPAVLGQPLQEHPAHLDHPLRHPRRGRARRGGHGREPRHGLPLGVLLAAAAVAAFGLFVMAGATPAALGLLADISERFPDDRGAIMGLYSVFLAIGQIIGALIGGFAAEAAGIDGMLVATGVLLLVALLPLARLRRAEDPVTGMIG